MYNIRRQEETYDYEKALQERIFAREDTAVQRRADDLEAAGLSKTLAAGSAAGTGQAIKPQSPQMAFDNARQGVALSNEIAMTKSQLKLNQAQQENIQSITELNRAKTAQADFDLALAEEIRPHTINQAAQASTQANRTTSIITDQAIMAKMDTEERLSMQDYLRNTYNLTEGQAQALALYAQINNVLTSTQLNLTRDQREKLELAWREYESKWYSTQRQVPGALGHISKDILTIGNILQEMWDRFFRRR